jgi:hypothetical protein
MWLRRSLLVAGLFSVSALVGAEARRNETVGTLDFFGLRRLSEAESAPS